MTLELTEIIGIVFLTTILTTASTYVIVSKEMSKTKNKICDRITEFENKLNDALITIGVLENNHQG